MNGIRRAVGVVLLVACASPAESGVERAGTTAASFLSVGSGAAALGMSGATLALPRGLGSLSWNAGSLGYLDQGEFVLSHAVLASESSQEWAAFGGRLGFGEMRWAVSGLFQSEGSFEGRDASNQSTGSFEVSSMAFGATLARPIGRIGSLGVGAKWVRESLGPGFDGSGLAFDAGLLMRAGMFGFGVAGQNLGGSMTFGSSAYPLPSSYGAGFSIAHAPSGVALDLDWNAPSDYYANLRGGIEWTWRERLALRAGYRKQIGAPSDDALNGPSFGMGAGAHGMWLDYGFLVTPSGEGQHRMGLSVNPGNMGLTGDVFGPKRMSRDYGPARETKTTSAEPAKRD